MNQVIHVITTIAYGGAENQLKVLVREQIRCGIQVEIFYLKDHPDLKKSFESFGAVVNSSLAGQNPLLQFLKLKKKLKSFDGIVHAHLPRAELISALATTKKNLIVSKHNTERFFPSAPKVVSRLLSKFVEKRSCSIVAISNAVLDFLIESGEVSSSSKIRVIHYGFDTDFKVKENFSKEINENFIVGTVARLTEQKDIQTLIHAFKYFHQSVPNSRLHIVGTGKLLYKLKKLVQYLKLEQSVLWVGRTNNVAIQLNQMDLFVLPSKYEGFGLVLLEAIQSGVPVVAARNSAIIEVIGSDSEGLFMTGNSIDLFHKLRDFHDFDNRRKLIKSQEMRLKLFDPSLMCMRVSQLYSEVHNE